MKIGMVSEFYYPQPGGISEHIRALSRELGLLGHEVVVVTGRIRGQVPEAGPRVIRLGHSIPVPYNGSLSRLSVGWRLGALLRQTLEEERFDLLHIHNPLMPTLPLLALHEARCPLVVTFHSAYQRDRLVEFLRGPLRRLLSKVQVCVPVSLSAHRTVGRLFPSEYRIIPNGVDVDLFSPGHARRAGHEEGLPRPACGRSQESLRLLFVGAMVRRKGLPVLIQAFRRLRRHRLDVELLVIGDGPEMGRARGQVPRALRGAVRFHGFVPRPALAGYYSTADIFCAPSLGQESFGMVLLEAMAAGLPVVASDIEGYRDVLAHGVEGMLVPPGDPEALAESLETLLDNRQERIRLGRLGRLKAAGYGWPRIARRLEAVYCEMLGFAPGSQEVPWVEPRGIRTQDWTTGDQLPIR